MLNSGGLGQIGDVIHNFSAALSGHENDVRELLTRLDEFVGVLDQQREKIVTSIEALNRLAGTFASQREIISQALRKIPPALDVLIRERPRITTALDKLRVFSNTATRLVNDTQADLVKNLQNLEPTLRALADVGPDLSTLLGYLPAFPFTQNFIDRAIRGDYFNVFAVVDMTVPRLKRTLGAGTRWGDTDAALVPAPGDPWYLGYTRDPFAAGITPPPLPASGPPPGAAAPLAPGSAADTCSRGFRYESHCPTGPSGWQLMLTRFVRIQLTIFIIAGIVGLACRRWCSRVHAGADAARDRAAHREQLGLPDTGGVYRFSNVTYPGCADRQGDRPVGPTATGAEATMSD